MSDRPAPASTAPASLRDVAALAGVSVSSVSLVVNGKAEGRVSSANQLAVRQAVDQLGYRADPVARGLAIGRRGTAAVIVPDLDSPFFNYVTAGIDATLGNDMQMLLALGRRDAMDLHETLGRMLAMRVDGIICSGVSADALLARTNVPCPVVLLDDPSDKTTQPRVTFDFANAASSVIDHLHQLGHQRIAYLTTAIEVTTFHVRLKLVRDRFKRTMPRRGQFYTATSETTTESADDAVSRHWPSWADAGVTALVCATDMQAYGALLALERLNVHVPTRCSVIGFDNLPFSNLTRPALTSVAMPARDLGIAAAHMLSELIEHRSTKTAVTLPTRLVIRRSTATAPRLP